MRAEAETCAPAQPMTPDSPLPEIEPEPDGKAEEDAASKAEGAAETGPSEVERARHSMEAIGLMTENLRLFLQSKNNG